ncbi:MAG: hypothetical protein KGZ83_04120 [Sulfuricella sp.]|nr:hypothetical protein [Sulfuricella sp.]
MPAVRFRVPLSAVVLGLLGLVALTGGGLALIGQLKHFHPLLNRDGGLALVVSGVALVLSASFPLAIAVLSAQRESAE